MLNHSDALGVFDSGVGGLSVVSALQKLAVNEEIYYLADTLHLPYGNKKPEEIEAYSIQNATYLLKYPLKALIIACHTASALAYEALKQRFNLPIFDVITPTVEEVSKCSQNKKVGVLATESTISSKVYEKLIKAKVPGAEVISVACPLLVPIVEENLLEHRLTQKLIQQYLIPLKNSDIDTLILGCTHYPFLKKLIQNELNREIEIIDSAMCCAQTVQSFLKMQNLETQSKVPQNYHFFVSGSPDSFKEKGNFLFNNQILNAKKLKF